MIGVGMSGLLVFQPLLDLSPPDTQLSRKDAAGQVLILNSTLEEQVLKMTLDIT